MSTSIEKFVQEEKIAATYWKNRGDAAKTAAELGYTLEHVNRIAKKMKAAVKWNVNNQLAYMIYSNFWLTHLQGIEILTKRVITLYDQSEKEASTCCDAVMMLGYSGEDQVPFCSKCKRAATTHIIQDVEINKLIIKFEEQIRKQQELLLESATKLGFTNAGPVTQVNQTIFAMTDNSKHVDKSTRKSQHLTIDAATAKEVELLDPQAQMRLAKKLENSIIDVKPEDGSDAKR